MARLIDWQMARQVRLQILQAAYFDGRCRISARASNRFESASLLVLTALSFSDGEKLLSFVSDPLLICELSAL